MHATGKLSKKIYIASIAVAVSPWVILLLSEKIRHLFLYLFVHPLVTIPLLVASAIVWAYGVESGNKNLEVVGASFSAYSLFLLGFYLNYFSRFGDIGLVMMLATIAIIISVIVAPYTK